jgi:hypothetical protein
MCAMPTLGAGSGVDRWHVTIGDFAGIDAQLIEAAPSAVTRAPLNR